MNSSRSIRALGLALSGAVLVLAGCGSAVVSSDVQPAAIALDQPNYAGLSVYSLSKAGFSIGVPTGWTAMTVEDAYSPSVNAIVKDAPKLGKFRDVFADAKSNFKLVALEYDPEACICSTIYVFSIPLDETFKARDFEAGGLKAARGFALPGTKPKVTKAKTPAGSGTRITTRTKLTGTDIPVISTQYFLHTRKSAYVLTYTASPDVTKTYARLFVRSARSLREV